MHLPSPSSPRPQRSDAAARARHRLAAVGLACAALATSAACVGAGTYNEVVTERDGLAKRNELLEASNEALSSERVALIEQLEDLRVERERLEKDVGKLRTQREKLSSSLSQREAQLAKQNEEVARLRGTYEALVTDLEKELAAGQIQIRQLSEGLQVNVAEDILFPSGSAALNPSGVEVLRKVAAELAKLPHEVEVDGHSDNVPIRGALTQRYPTNWELAGARAASVVRVFEKHGIDGTRLSAVSHAEFQPVAPNDSAANRALNRRIEIRLRPPTSPSARSAERASE